MWQSVLKNEKFRLKHGYFVTRQPDQDLLDQGVTHAEARVYEKEFFSTKEPWAIEFASFSDRFGTEHLQTTLSEKLTVQYLKKYVIINPANRLLGTVVLICI